MIPLYMNEKGKFYLFFPTPKKKDITMLISINYLAIRGKKCGG